jgi:hypothetical protein
MSFLCTFRCFGKRFSGLQFCSFPDLFLPDILDSGNILNLCRESCFRNSQKGKNKIKEGSIIGVDISITLYKALKSAEASDQFWQDPIVPVTGVEQALEKLKSILDNAKIDYVFVFDGCRHLLRVILLPTGQINVLQQRRSYLVYY